MSKVKLNTIVLDKLIAETPKRADKVGEKICKDMQADIDQHWSSSSPSSPGEPPAVVTGELKASADAQRMAPGAWRLVYTSDHAIFLEYGTMKMAARPYLQPASERMRPKLADYYKELFSL